MEQRHTEIPRTTSASTSLFGQKKSESSWRIHHISCPPKSRPHELQSPTHHRQTDAQTRYAAAKGKKLPKERSFFLFKRINQTSSAHANRTLFQLATVILQTKQSRGTAFVNFGPLIESLLATAFLRVHLAAVNFRLFQTEIPQNLRRTHRGRVNTHWTSCSQGSLRGNIDRAADSFPLIPCWGSRIGKARDFKFLRACGFVP